MRKDMTTLSKKDRENLIAILKSGKEIPAKYRDMLINEEAPKEYELIYAGKAREEDIIADTLAAPLQEVRTFNSDNKFDDDWTNKLIFGDNLMALKSLYEDPKIKGKVKLIYIDPPFATKQDFMAKEEKAYQDKVTGANFLEFTRKRLIFLKELLADDGVLYVHLDQKKGHYVKCILDELFTETHFENEIIWNYAWGIRTEKQWNKKHDVIYMYSRGSSFVFNANEVQEERKMSEGTKNRLKYKGALIRDVNKRGKEEMALPTDVWYIATINAMAAERTEYPTQKPEELLAKIIKASSSEGDIILDAFAGSGTTLAVGEKLKRRWIGIDCGKFAIYTIQKRILNLHEEIGDKGKSLKAKAFTFFNAGLYDWTEVKKLDYQHYRDFVLKLFQVREEKHVVRGIEIDGYIGNDNAYLWDHTKEKKAKLDLGFVKSLHSALSGKGGEVFYIIAPTNIFAFFEDEVKLDDTTYKTLRVPQSVIAELMKRGGEALKQPTNEQDVNDTIDAVGFDFIQVPDVEILCGIGKPKKEDLFKSDKECIIKIKTFKSRTLTKSPEEFKNYETLSMVMMDYNYDGRVFDLDEVFYADNIKPDFEVRFDSKKIDKQMMAIYLDIYGNEKKEILSLKDFKK